MGYNCSAEDRLARACPQRSQEFNRTFAFAPMSLAEREGPRTVRLRVCSELGAGLQLRPTWHGMVVDEVEKAPGQPGLRDGDCIFRIRGPLAASWAEGSELAGQKDCEDIFAQSFQDGASIMVESHCETSGSIPRGMNVNWKTLRLDLAAFARDYEVGIHLSDGDTRVLLSGPQSAVASARAAATQLLNMHFAQLAPKAATAKC